MLSTTAPPDRLAELAVRLARPVPRYTSYPTVPYWNAAPYGSERWLSLLRSSVAQAGVSVYVHLPFCERLCTYCACNKRITRRHEVEAPYVDALLAEWALYREALPPDTPLHQLHLGGGTPTFFSAAELERLVTGLTAGIRRDRRRDWSVEVHPAQVNREQLEVLARAGFNRLSIGVQDVDDAVLRRINRPQRPEQIDAVVAWARALGFASINVDLVYGLPGQGLAQMAANVAAVARWRPERIACYAYAHVPWKSPGQRGYAESDLPDDTERWALRSAAEAGFVALGYEQVGFDHYALPQDRLVRAARSGRLHRNFMGFTTHRGTALVGLGCSAISELDGAFAQNHKSVEAYQDAVGAGRFAHAHGHRPEGRDQEVGRLIRELLCRGSVTLPAFDLGYTLPALDRLREPLALGLARLDGLRLELTDAGQRFARHVAQALDERLWAEAPRTTPTFSQG